MGRSPGSVQRPRKERVFDAAEFGRLVRHKIEGAGLTMAKASVVIGMNRSTLNRIASGFPPTLKNYLRLRQWLEETPPVIIADQPEKQE